MALFKQGSFLKNEMINKKEHLVCITSSNIYFWNIFAFNLEVVKSAQQDVFEEGWFEDEGKESCYRETMVSYAEFLLTSQFPS